MGRAVAAVAEDVGGAVAAVAEDIRNSYSKDSAGATDAAAFVIN